MVKTVKNAKIALLDFSLQRHKMKHGVKLIVSDPKELEKMRERYFIYIKKKIFLKIFFVGYLFFVSF